MICESVYLPIFFGNTKLGLAWSWYATYFIFFLFVGALPSFPLGLPSPRASKIQS